MLSMSLSPLPPHPTLAVLLAIDVHGIVFFYGAVPLVGCFHLCGV